MTTSEPRGRKQVMPQDRDFPRRFGAALRFANELHAAQTRKSTTIPYISHLMGVASLVLEHGGSADEAIAALLHDSVEDQAEEYPGGATSLRAYIHDAFGPACGKFLSRVFSCASLDS